jgi:hypothetical protein
MEENNDVAGIEQAAAAAQETTLIQALKHQAAISMLQMEFHQGKQIGIIRRLFWYEGAWCVSQKWRKWSVIYRGNLDTALQVLMHGKPEVAQTETFQAVSENISTCLMLPDDVYTRNSEKFKDVDTYGAMAAIKRQYIQLWHEVLRLRQLMIAEQQKNSHNQGDPDDLRPS